MTNDSIMDMDIEDCERDSVKEEGFSFDHSEVFLCVLKLSFTTHSITNTVHIP